MKVIFGRRPAVGSWVIRFATWSDWSHCGVISASGDVIHSTWPSGVHRTPLHEWLRKYPANEVLDVPLKDEKAAMSWLELQIGKPYDLSGLIAFGTHRDWQEEDKWFCSELVGAAFVAGGLVFRVPSARLTPGGLYLVASTHS